MPVAAFSQTVENSEQYADYLFGFCLEKVRGAALREHSTDLENWPPLGSAKLTEGLKLFNPRVSPDTFTILDLDSSNKSCWTQHDTVAAPLSMQPILAVLTNQPDGHISLLDEENGEGFEQRTYLYNPDEGVNPVVVYFYVMTSGATNRIVGIVKEATLTLKND